MIVEEQKPVTIIEPYAQQVEITELSPNQSKFEIHPVDPQHTVPDTERVLVGENSHDGDGTEVQDESEEVDPIVAFVEDKWPEFDEDNSGSLNKDETRRLV